MIIVYQTTKTIKPTLFGTFIIYPTNILSQKPCQANLTTFFYFLFFALVLTLNIIYSKIIMYIWGCV